VVDRRRLVAISLWLAMTVAVALAVVTIAALTGLVELWGEGGSVPPDVRHGSRLLGQGLYPVDVRGESPLIEITTRKTGKPIRLYVVERGGKRCRVLVSPGGTGTGCGGRGARPTEVGVHPNRIGAAPDGMVLLGGQVGSEVSRLDLHFEDDRVERLPLSEQFALYQVDPADFAAGRRPLRLIGRDEDGKAIGEQRLNLLR
jgi:hypothetical protein